MKTSFSCSDLRRLGAAIPVNLRFEAKAKAAIPVASGLRRKSARGRIETRLFIGRDASEEGVSRSDVAA